MYYLDCSFSEITSLDISKNQELTSISCNKNRLTSIDLSKNTNITGVDCGENLLSSVDLSKNAGLTWLSLYGNQLTNVDLSKNTELLFLDLARNLLSDIDVTQNTKLTSFSCAGNDLTSLDVSKNHSLFRLECSYNKLTFATLPIRSMQEYRYFPQQPVTIEKQYSKGESIDLSELNSAGNATTVYALKTKGGTNLIPGTHYRIENGKITLLESLSDSIYCIMTNATFPYFKDGNVLTTTLTWITNESGPTGIEEINEEYTISPNPVVNSLYIKEPLGVMVKYSVVSLTGATIMTGTVSAGTIDVSGLNDGIYLLRLYDSGKEYKTVRFVKK
jgi:hypothetical protein